MCETKNDEIVHPTHCFCEFPVEELRSWAQKRYREQISTMDLLRSTENTHDKEVISAVALLDLDQGTMLSLMGNVDMPEHHLIHCRLQVREMLGLD